MTAGVAKLVTVRDAAREAKWTCAAGKRHCRCNECDNGHRRMLRLLEKANQENNGMILVRRGSVENPRWLVSLDAVRRLLPQLAKCEAPAADADLEETVQRQAELLRLAHQHIGELRREVTETRETVDRLEDAVQMLKDILLKKGAA